ncbi:MAG: peptidylprolyl isomerase [Bacteroidia bacterium]
MLIPLVLLACKTSKTTQSAEAGPVLLKFAPGIVSQAEFERVYAKNNGGRDSAARHSVAQYREYLDLYINFKRKVFEAEAQGLHETAAFKQEFETYRKQLAQPYLSARDVEARLVEEAYARSRYLVHASHLLIAVAEDALPADTLAAYQQTLAYRDSLLGGKVFGELASRYSADPSARDNQGDLGYFSVFDMVYPFESAAYNTPVGEVSQPVRTRFGYHLVYVHDRIETEGKKQAAHIIIRWGDRYPAKSEPEARQRIDEIYKRLQDGEDFAMLARQFSDDPSSGPRGGDLGSGRLLPVMEDIKLRLGEGQVSEPFETPYGWHVMKITRIERLPDLEAARADLKARIGRDSRSQLSRQALLERIRTENNYRFFDQNFQAFKATLDERFATGTWKPDSSRQDLYAQSLFTLGSDYTATIQDYIDYYLKTRQRRGRMEADKAADDIYEGFRDEQLLAYEEDRLPEKNPEYRYLLQEYRDGILLFTLMEQKVWKKAVEDTLGLRTYYEQHQEDFRAGQRVEVQEYRSPDEDIAERVAALLAEGRQEAEIDSLLSLDSPLQLRIFPQTYEKGRDSLDAAIYDQPVGYVSPVLAEEGYYRVLQVREQYPAGIKPFAQAKSEAITRYQDYLEKQWLDELAAKYPVTINEKIFERLFQ